MEGGGEAFEEMEGLLAQDEIALLRSELHRHVVDTPPKSAAAVEQQC